MKNEINELINKYEKEIKQLYERQNHRGELMLERLDTTDSRIHALEQVVKDLKKLSETKSFTESELFDFARFYSEKSREGMRPLGKIFNNWLKQNEKDA